MWHTAGGVPIGPDGTRDVGAETATGDVLNAACSHVMRIRRYDPI